MKKNEISLRVLNTLGRANVALASLESMSVDDILSIKGIGQAALTEIQQYFSTLDDSECEAYNPASQAMRRAEYNSSIVGIATTILNGNTIENGMENVLKLARLDSLKLRGQLSLDSMPETAVSEDSYGKAIADYSELTRKKLWGYRRAAIRTALLGTILSSTVNKKKLGFRLQKCMEAIVDVVLSVGDNEVTLSQIVHRISPIVAVDQYVTKEGVLRASSHWLNDELALQFVNELAEQDYLDVHISDKTHMVRITNRIVDGLDKAELVELSRTAKFLALNTILTKAPGMRKDMISRRSWWYDTPELSDDQIEYANIMNNVKYGFTDTAEDEVEELFRLHLKVDVLPTWAKTRVDEYKAQIRASRLNGGHYVAGKWDSATRWYYSSDIGQVQTSKHLRSIVTYDGMSNPVKYDFRNNVVQMYSLLTGVRSLGHYVGLTPANEQLGDLRELLASRMNSELNVSSFNKDNVKPLFMIWAYNAGQRRLMGGVVKTETDFITGRVTTKQTVKGLYAIANIDDEDRVWDAWTSILNELVPSIVGLKMLFRKLFKANPISEISWTMPDGTIAQYASVATIDEPLHWVDSKYKMHTHTHYRKHISIGEKNAGGLPRIIHSFDAYVKRQLVVRAHRLGFTVVPNHDSFIFDECHKAQFDELVDTIFNELRESEALSSIVKELNVAGQDLTILDGENNVVTTASFGDTLSSADVLSGTPTAMEEM